MSANLRGIDSTTSLSNAKPNHLAESRLTHRMILTYGRDPVRGVRSTPAATFGCLLGACVVDQDVPHDLRSDRQKLFLSFPTARSLA